MIWKERWSHSIELTKDRNKNYVYFVDLNFILQINYVQPLDTQNII